MENTLIEMRSISKAFTGVQALHNCSLHILKGEVHALLGENGAGKSTLMKILNGIYHPDEGEIFFEGKKVSINSVLDARALGITMIHQELNMLTNLTVAQNIFLGKEKRKKGIFLDETALNDEAAELLRKVSLDLDPRTMVSELTVAQQQMVEIAKAMSYESKLIIMDEPTAPLSSSETDSLFRMISGMKKQGISVIYISHRMDEIKRICDRATILRDGQYIETVGLAGASMDDIISAMVGRKIVYSREKAAKDRISEEKVLELRGISWGSKVKNVSFFLRRGEILGLAGLVGAGRTETARLIFGAERPDSGEILVKGRRKDIGSPWDGVKNGISYLSEDRKQYGLITEMSVENNIGIASLDKLCRGLGFIDRGKSAAETERLISALKIKTPSPDTSVKFLSGGNQQKTVVAKWLLRDTDILIFDEPTRGIDIGAKEEICSLLVELADMGKSVIMISSEMQELLRVCDRIIVMHEGEITGELMAGEATQEKILRLASKM